MPDVSKIIPHNAFYKVFTPAQIQDIAISIETYGEIPLQYSYMGRGADYWDKHMERLAKEKTSNILKSTVSLLESRLDDLNSLLGSDKKINIIDLGPGNGKPIHRLLSHFSDTGQLKRYIAVDISKDILKLTERHILKNFGHRVKFEGHIRDFSREYLNDLIAPGDAHYDINAPANIVIMLSGTLCNFRLPAEALRTISSSLGVNDLFLYTTKLDTANSRGYFDLGLKTTPQPKDFLFKTILDLLNIDGSLYNLDQYFDEVKRARHIEMRPVIDLTIEFKLANQTRKVILHRNEPILLWRYWHYDILGIINEFDANGFDLLQAAKTADQEYFLSISKPKQSVPHFLNSIM